MQESENLTLPSSLRSAKGQTTRPYNEPPVPTDAQPASLSLPSSQRMSGTPLARAMTDLRDAKRELERKGADEAAIVSAVAKKLRAKVQAMPAGAAEPMSEAEINKLVDGCIAEILGKQTKRTHVMVGQTLRMSCVRAAVTLLAADHNATAKKRADDQAAIGNAQRRAVALTNKTRRWCAVQSPIALSNAKPLMECGRKDFPYGICFF